MEPIASSPSIRVDLTSTLRPREMRELRRSCAVYGTDNAPWVSKIRRHEAAPRRPKDNAKVVHNGVAVVGASWRREGVALRNPPVANVKEPEETSLRREGHSVSGCARVCGRASGE